MKIKKSLFSDFIKESALSGEFVLREVKLDFSDKGLIITSATLDNSCMVKAQIPSSSFEDYSEIGKIAILNYSELLKIVSTLNDDIYIQKEGNVLILKGGRKVEIPLADVTAIRDISKVPNLEYDISFVTNKQFFDEINNNLSFSLNSSDSATVLFTGVNKKLIAKYGTKYKFEDKLDVESIPNSDNDLPLEVKFGKIFFDAIANIKGDIQVSLKSEYPATIIKKTDMYALKIIIAPKV